MDFSKYDARAAADKGSKMHVKDPVTGEPIFDNGKPCYVILMGTEGLRGQEIIAESAKNLKSADTSEETPEERHQKNVQETAKFILGFENISRGDKPATNSIEDCEWFLNLQVIGGNREEKSFLEQCREHIVTRGEFLGKD